MSGARLAPTRSQLLRSRDRLARVARGIDLLTRKRKALAAELFGVAAPAIAARARIGECAASAYPALLAARAARGGAELEALGWPSRQLEIEVAISETWGIATAEVKRLVPARRSLLDRGQSPGWTGPAAGIASAEFERLLELLLDAASTELRLRRLAEALARTSRQVNTLERRVAPELEAEVHRVRGLLEEREREDHTRLKRLSGLPRAGRSTPASR
jgi:V/A-type H+-transporting ATPase subunit D